MDREKTAAAFRNIINLAQESIWHDSPYRHEGEDQDDINLMKQYYAQHFGDL